MAFLPPSDTQDNNLDAELDDVELLKWQNSVDVTTITKKDDMFDYLQHSMPVRVSVKGPDTNQVDSIVFLGCSRNLLSWQAQLKRGSQIEEYKKLDLLLARLYELCDKKPPSDISTCPMKYFSIHLKQNGTYSSIPMNSIIRPELLVPSIKKDPADAGGSSNTYGTKASPDRKQISKDNNNASPDGQKRKKVSGSPKNRKEESEVSAAKTPSDSKRNANKDSNASPETPKKKRIRKSPSNRIEEDSEYTTTTSQSSGSTKIIDYDTAGPEGWSRFVGMMIPGLREGFARAAGISVGDANKVIAATLELIDSFKADAARGSG